VISNTSS